MPTFIQVDQYGSITRLVRPPFGEVPSGDGFFEVKDADHISALTHWWDGVSVQPYPPDIRLARQRVPGPGFVWVGVAGGWRDERPIEVQIEEAWKLVRAERDRLLAETDWRVTKAVETGIPLSAEWQAYRQALRDITTVENPSLVVWPVPPA